MNPHGFRWVLAVGADMFAAVPQCTCGWRGGLCWNVRAAHAAWVTHSEAPPAPTTPEHDVVITAATFGFQVARCKTCGWFTAPITYQDAQVQAAMHRTSTPPSAAVQPAAFYSDLWTAETFDADVAERDAIARHHRT